MINQIRFRNIYFNTGISQEWVYVSPTHCLKKQRKSNIPEKLE